MKCGAPKNFHQDERQCTFNVVCNFRFLYFSVNSIRCHIVISLFCSVSIGVRANIRDVNARGIFQNKEVTSRIEPKTKGKLLFIVK
jgi:hypothetical protein